MATQKTYHVKKFLTEKQLLTTNSSQNMNDKKKYTVVVPYVGHPSITFKKSLYKKARSLTKKCCTIYKTFNVQCYFSLKVETPLAQQANVGYLLKVLVIRTKPILVLL